MYSFIILGQVPGTNIQIDFDIWLRVTLLLLLAGAVLQLLSVHRRFISNDYSLRQPLHASQLHRRV